MQPRVLHPQEKPILQQEKEMRFLRPSPFMRNGKRLYSNKLGQEFFARARVDKDPGNYSIEVFQVGEGEPIARFSAAAQLMGKTLMIKFMTRTGWESLPDRRARTPTGYCAARIIFNEAISLAQKLGARTIYLEAVSHKLFAYYQSLGFKEVPGTRHMQLEVPGGARNP